MQQAYSDFMGMMPGAQQQAPGGQMSLDEIMKMLQAKMGGGNPMGTMGTGAMSGMLGAGPTPQATALPEPFAGKAPSPLEMRQYLQDARKNPNADMLYGMNPNALNAHATPGLTMDQRMAQDPNYRGMRMSMASGRGLGESLKELPYDMKRGFQGKNALGTAAGAGMGMLMGKGGSQTEQALATTGGTIGAALGTMIPIPFVGQALGGAIGSAAGKVLGGLFGNDEEEAKKKAEKSQKVDSLRGNLDRIAAMYRGGR